MGCGKSAIGKRLAEKLELPFIDLDTAIEEKTGLTIPEIFEQHGEGYFRKLERDILREIIAGEPKIIATGGGAFINEESRKLIKEKSLSVWIKADFALLLERVSRKNNRPLLEKGDKAAILKDLMNKRYPIYAEADITVETTDGPHEIVVDKIISLI